MATYQPLPLPKHPSVWHWTEYIPVKVGMILAEQRPGWYSDDIVRVTAVRKDEWEGVLLMSQNNRDVGSRISVRYWPGWHVKHVAWEQIGEMANGVESEKAL